MHPAKHSPLIPAALALAVSLALAPAALLGGLATPTRPVALPARVLPRPVPIEDPQKCLTNTGHAFASVVCGAATSCSAVRDSPPGTRARILHACSGSP